MTIVLVRNARDLDGQYGLAALDARETPDGRFAYSLAVLDDPTFASVRDELDDCAREAIVWPEPEGEP